jgi:SAM-dependent methyltransferase
MNKTPQPYWDKQSEQVEFHPLGASDPIRLLINKYVPRNNLGTAFEAGCYPGRFLAVFGDLGYTLSGVDATPRVIETSRVLQQKNYKIGRIVKEDFFKLPEECKYTVVGSFGFIEHFENYRQVIQKHCLHVEKGGCLVISAPNLRYGIPYFFHRWLNSSSFKHHVLESMEPAVWKQVVQENNFELLFAGYCGGIDLWQSGEQTGWQQVISRIIIAALRYLKLIFFWIDFKQVNNRYISCDFMVIAKRKN